jgi:hypothetical protein
MNELPTVSPEVWWKEEAESIVRDSDKNIPTGIALRFLSLVEKAHALGRQAALKEAEEAVSFCNGNKQTLRDALSAIRSLAKKEV